MRQKKYFETKLEYLMKIRQEWLDYGTKIAKDWEAWLNNILAYQNSEEWQLIS